MSAAPPYAVFDPSGRIVYVGLHPDEDDCWQVFLGWPSDEEIAAEKLKGAHVKRVDVLPMARKFIDDGECD